MKLQLATFAALLALARAKSIAESVADVTELSSLATLLSNEAYKDIVEALGDTSKEFTLFAPNNEAFAKLAADTNDTELISNVLLYHVLGAKVLSNQITKPSFPTTLLTSDKYVQLGDGKGQVVGVAPADGTVVIKHGDPDATASVVRADIEADNGVIHVIDTVLTIPPALEDLLKSSPSVSTLTSLLTQEKLVEALSAVKGITVFAPSNDAFAEVDLAEIPKEDVTPILQYHVLASGAVYSADITEELEPETLEGGNVTVKAEGNEVTVNQAKVIAPDTLVKNGVVHAIDAVLTPSDSDKSSDDKEDSDDDSDSDAATVAYGFSPFVATALASVVALLARAA